MFGIHRGYRRSSSSDEDGGAPQPPTARPPAGLPGLRPHKVRRALFGPTDPEENIRFVRQELKKHKEIQSSRWNFDFERGQPLKGRFEWDQVPRDQIHPVYNCSRLEYLSSNEVSVQQENIQNTPLEHSMLGHSVLKTTRTGSIDDLKTSEGGASSTCTPPGSTNVPPGLPSSRSVPSNLSGSSQSSISSGRMYDEGGGGGGGTEPQATTFRGGSGPAAALVNVVGSSSGGSQMSTSSQNRGRSDWEVRNDPGHAEVPPPATSQHVPVSSLLQASASTAELPPATPAKQQFKVPSTSVQSSRGGVGASDTSTNSENMAHGARPKTKEQKITDAFRSRKLSRSKSAGKLKRLTGGASSNPSASRSPSVKARQQSRSNLPRS